MTRDEQTQCGALHSLTDSQNDDAFTSAAVLKKCAVEVVLFIIDQPTLSRGREARSTF